MKDYRKTKARFFLGLFFFLSLTGLGITWIIYSALTKEVEVGKYESSFPALIARIIRLSSSAVLGQKYRLPNRHIAENLIIASQIGNGFNIRHTLTSCDFLC